MLDMEAGNAQHMKMEPRAIDATKQSIAALTINPTQSDQPTQPDNKHRIITIKAFSVRNRLAIL